MQEIRVDTQSQWEELPEKFEIFTRISIYGKGLIIKKTPFNAKVMLQEDSRAELLDNSSAVLRGNARAETYKTSCVYVHSPSATIEKLKDNSICIYKCNNQNKIPDKDRTATVIDFKDIITPSFEEWINRGYVVADGLIKSLLSHENKEGIDIYTCCDFTSKISYLAKKGEYTAHGETKEEAIQDLIFKTSNRNLDQFKNWKINDVKTKDELIFAYRCITGACKQGIKEFVNSKEIPEKMKIEDAIRITQRSYGGETFKSFFNKDN